MQALPNIVPSSNSALSQAPQTNNPAANQDAGDVDFPLLLKSQGEAQNSNASPIENALAQPKNATVTHTSFSGTLSLDMDFSFEGLMTEVPKAGDALEALRANMSSLGNADEIEEFVTQLRDQIGALQMSDGQAEELFNRINSEISAIARAAEGEDGAPMMNIASLFEMVAEITQEMKQNGGTEAPPTLDMTSEAIPAEGSEPDPALPATPVSDLTEAAETLTPDAAMPEEATAETAEMAAPTVAGQTVGETPEMPDAQAASLVTPAAVSDTETEVTLPEGEEVLKTTESPGTPSMTSQTAATQAAAAATPVAPGSAAPGPVASTVPDGAADPELAPNAQIAAQPAATDGQEATSTAAPTDPRTAAQSMTAAGGENLKPSGPIPAVTQPTPQTASASPQVIETVQTQSVDAPTNVAKTSAEPTAAFSFARNVAAQVRGTSFEEGKTRIELAPRGLGDIEVEVARDDAGKLKVVLRAENPSVLTAFRGDRDVIVNMLRESGLEVDDAEVGFESFEGHSDRQETAQIDLDSFQGASVVTEADIEDETEVTVAPETVPESMTGANLAGLAPEQELDITT